MKYKSGKGTQWLWVMRWSCSIVPFGFVHDWFATFLGWKTKAYVWVAYLPMFLPFSLVRCIWLFTFCGLQVHTLSAEACFQCCELRMTILSCVCFLFFWSSYKWLSFIVPNRWIFEKSEENRLIKQYGSKRMPKYYGLS
jgi:hypothetical protein